MTFQMAVCSLRDESVVWTEDYDRENVIDQASAEKAAALIIEDYNAYLREHEAARKVVSVIFGAGDAVPEPKPHDWKKTNLVTVSNKSGSWDEYKCNACGITAKRHGLGGDMIRDNKYKDRVSCELVVAKPARAKVERRGTPAQLSAPIGARLRKLDEEVNIAWQEYAQGHDPIVLETITAVQKYKDDLYAQL